MKNNKKGLSPIALILIITTSIVAATGIILLVLKFVQKKREKKALESCDCCDCDDLDSWEFDDADILGDLSFDDEELYAHNDEQVAASVDEAIEAVGAACSDSEDADK